MKTYLFVRNKKYRPSTYYRIMQYIEGNKNLDIKISEYETNSYYEIKNVNKFTSVIKKLSGYIGYVRRVVFLSKMLFEKDYNIFVQREVFPKYIDPIGKWLLQQNVAKADNIYWDFDDNIIKAKEITAFGKELLSYHAKQIIVGNQYLRNTLSDQHRSKSLILNTTDKMMEIINLEKVNNLRLLNYEKEVVIIWVGTKINLQYLQNIIQVLDLAALELINKKLTLKIVSNFKLEIPTKKLNIVNVEWEREKAFEEMLNAHIGIMPLIEDEITKGKCAFKAVQNIGCGLPVIVSNVGMNNEVISDNGYLINEKSDWKNYIVELSNDKDAWLLKSINSRKLWESRFNSSNVKESLSEFFKV